MKWKLLGLQDECHTKKRRVPASFTWPVGLSKELLQSADVPDNTVLSSEIPVITGGNTIELATELNKAMARIAELESVEIITVRCHEILLEEDKNDVLRRSTSGRRLWTRMWLV